MDIIVVKEKLKELTSERRGLETRLNELGRQIAALEQRRIQMIADMNANGGAIQVLEELVKGEILPPEEERR